MLKKRLLSVVLCLCMVVGILPAITPTSQAAGTGIADKLDWIKKNVFPEGKYWNHYVSKPGQDCDSLPKWDETYVNTVTDTPCAHHGDGYAGNYVGLYDCNRFDGGSQCWGFANAVFYKVFGVYRSKYPKDSDMGNVKPGDYLRFGTDEYGHSVFVLTRDGDKITVVECNFGTKSSDRCQIKWGREIYLSKGSYGLPFGYCVHAPQDIYDKVNGTSSQPSVGSTAPSQRVYPSDNFFARIYNPHSNCYLENRNGNVQTANSDLYDPHQIWQFIHDDSKGSYEIKNLYDGRCLDADDWGTANGTNVHVWEDNDCDAQRWWLCGPSRETGQNHNFYFVPRYLGNHQMVMDIVDGYDVRPAGTNIQLFHNHYKDAGEFQVPQTFWIMPVDNTGQVLTRYANNILPSDFYAQISYGEISYLKTTGSVMSFPEGSGMDVQVTRMLDMSDPKQIWHFIRQSNGSYKIVNEYSNWCLDVQGGIVEPGQTKNVWTWHDDHGDAPERWYLIKAPGENQYRILSALGYPRDRYSMVLPNNNAAEGANVEIYNQNQNPWQFFYISPMSYTRPNRPATPQNARVIATPNGTTITYSSVPTVSAYDKRSYEFQLFNNRTGEDVLGYRYRTSLTTYPFEDIVLPEGDYRLEVRAVNNKYPRTSSNYASATSYTYFSVRPAYTISVNTLSGGTVRGSGTYDKDTSATAVASPYTGYHFVEWQENGRQVSTNASYTFTVTGSRTLTAVFEKDAPITPVYTVRVNASEGGSASGGGSYKQGESATVTAVPGSGYTFKEWQWSGGSSTDNPLTFSVGEDQELTAVFEKIPDAPEQPKDNYYTIRLDTQPLNVGSVTGDGVYKDGTSVTVKAAPHDGHRFVRWTENSAEVSRDAEYSFAVNADRNLTAVFEDDGPVQVAHTIRVNATAGGTASGGGTYRQGESVTVTAEANSGYRFVGWQIGEAQVSADATYTFPATAEQELTAVFEPVDGPSTALFYDVDVTAVPTAGGSVSGDGRYEEGAAVRVLASPSSGYRFVGWTQDGETVSTDAAYTFEVHENKYLTAVFETENCTITVNADPAEGGTVSGGGVCERGSSATVTAVPGDGYRFEEWLANGVMMSTDASYTFAVNGDRTLTAKFSQIDAPSEVRVNVTKTNIRADSVFNDGGYGSLVINGNWREYADEDSDNLVPPQIALIDRSGSFKFPYREDSNDNYFTNGARFHYSDGIVSLTLDSAYENGELPQYYTLSGSNAFTLEETHNEYTDANGISRVEDTSYLGGPMTDGYAVVIKKLYSSWSAGIAGGGSDAGENLTQIIDKNGVVTCELPPEYNQYMNWGAGGFDTKKSLGWCGEGLFAFFERVQTSDFGFTTEAKGYMDPTGRTVIDLAGQGYTNLLPFHQGLAAAKDQNGKWGFIDKTGAQIIPCLYEACYSFGSDGLCAVKMNGQWGYIDRNNQTVIPFAYDDAFGASDGLASVVKAGKCGLVDYNNSIIVPLEYDDISSYEGGVAYALKDGAIYIISASATPNTRVVSVSASPASGGTVTGSGSYQQGASVTVSATANSDYRFVRWTENGTEVGTSASYTFTVGSDRTLVAEFAYTGGSSTPSNPSYPSNPGSSSSGTPTTQKPSLPVKTDKVESSTATETIASPTASISNGKATCNITTAIAEEMIKQAVANNSENVIIAPEIKGDVAKTEVTIPAAAVGRIGKETNANLTVSTPAGNVTIPNSALSGLSSGNNLAVTMEQNNSQVALTIAADGQAINTVTGGVTLEVPVTNATPGTVAVLVGEDGSRQIVRKSVVNGGSIIVPLDGSAKVEIMDNAKTFADVPAGNWAVNAVAFASGHELFNGTAPDTFSSSTPMTRGMLAVVLHNLENNPESGSAAAFSDVASGAWYEKAVSWASERGIISGYGNGLFGPGDNITREQLAVILWRYSGSPVTNSSALDGFSDAKTASAYAKDALKWAVESKIINGTGNGVLNPKGPATRAQVAQIFMNYMMK